MHPRSISVPAPETMVMTAACRGLQAWIEHAADHMKAVDPNHMVTIGEEGFYGFGASAAQLATNPNSDNTGYVLHALSTVGQARVQTTICVTVCNARHNWPQHQHCHLKWPSVFHAALIQLLDCCSFHYTTACKAHNN